MSKEEKKNKNSKTDEQKVISNFISSRKDKRLSLPVVNIPTNYLNMENVNINNNPNYLKNMEEKIEKYVDKKLMQLNLQIEEIDELFNVEKYFKEKEDKMKQYTNLPYIKENFDFVAKYADDDYEKKIEEIRTIYKELK